MKWAVPMMGVSTKDSCARSWWSVSFLSVLIFSMSGKIHAGNPAQLYYAVIALAGNHFSLAPEYELVTGLPAHTDAAIEETIKLINRVMFIEPA